MVFTGRPARSELCDEYLSVFSGEEWMNSSDIKKVSTGSGEIVNVR